MIDLSYIQFDGTPLQPDGRFQPRNSLRLPELAARSRVMAAKRRGDEPLDAFLAWLLDRAGLQTTAFRAAALNRRLNSCLRLLRVPSPKAAQETLARRPELLRDALSTVLIGVTQFFRDPTVFGCLRTQVLPELLAKRRQIRVVSLGASRGHELYSVAMLLAQAGALDRSELLGIDCRTDAIAAAETGCFDAEDVASMEECWKDTYFERMENQAVVRDDLRARCRWRVADLLTCELEGVFDLVLFRNVAIYLDGEASERAWERLCAVVAPDGFLVTGKAEKPPGWLPLTRVAPSLYRKLPR